ncbi:STA5B-like protein [Mya arenaria]|uniref:STA5B-like protein n=1 Tax=Mya arenaria TaxID=6604 RepID=A0ABY7G740_MYAAR|nr:STA5B-like protein [Mya arenaria]
MTMCCSLLKQDRFAKMASPLETDVWGTNGKTGEKPVGMIAFMQKDPDLTYLSTEWDKLLKELEVDIFLRNDMDSWFQKCFKLYTCAKSRFQANKEKLSDEFVTEMKRKLELSRPGETANDNKGAVTNYLQRLRAFDQLKQKINDGTVVEMAVICIRREQDLIMALCPECGRLLGSIQEILPELTRTLNNQIEEWKQQFKLQYAELYADANVEPIAKRSSEIWGFLQELRAIVIEQLSRLVNENSISEIKQAIARTAYLLYDEDLNDCWNGRELDFEMVVGRRKDVNGKPSVRFTKENKGRFKATFNSLTVDKIKRPKSGKQVHEEKYRFVFVTKFDETLLLTVSLPLVIVTATNQQCHAMASIMWECFSTNVFQLPVCVPVELPWSTIAEMLNAKIRRLCPTRALTDDNIKHLKHRLIDKENSSFDGKTQNWKVTIDLPERDTPFLGKQPCPPDEDSKSLVFPFGTHEYQANTAKYPKLSIPSSLPPLIRFETISSALGNSPVPGSQCQSQQHIPRLPTLSKPFHMSNQNQNNMTSHQSSQAHAQGIRMLGPSVDTLHLDNKMTQAFSEEKPGPPIHQTETPFEHTPISLTEKTLYANIQEKQSESADAGSPMLVDESPVTSGVDTAEGFDRQMQSIASALFRLSVEKRTKVMQYVKTRDNTLLTSGQHSAVGNTVETAATGASFMSVQYANVSSCPDVQNTVTSTAVTGTNDSGNSTSEPEISSGELERANNSGNILPEFWDQQQITDI